MIVLHIAAITNYIYNGVNVVAPQHVEYQGRFAKTALLNIRDYRVKNGITQYEYEKGLKISSLPEPFNCPDLVVFHEVYIQEYLAIAKEMLERNIPYIILPHGELTKEAQRKKWWKKKLANIILFQSFICNAVAVQCLSQRELDSTKFGVRKFIGTNGVAIPEKMKEYGLKEEVKFTYIGRLDVYHKGLDLLIVAVKSIAQYMRNNRCTVDIYGPDHVGRFAQVAALIHDNEVSDIVKLHHEISGAEKEHSLLSTDVFIQTSRFEGMPLGIIEALSYGIPCLVTEGTTLGSFIRNAAAGWVANNEAESVAAQMMDACENKDQFLSMSTHARKLAKDEFDWEAITQKTVAMYKEIISSEQK